MVKTLVVMRHGKAARPSQDQRDEDRKLTQAGRDALDARLPQMLRLLETKGAAVQVWTSPARRARQTARLLERGLKQRGVRLEGAMEQHESLWEQDVDAFLDELRTSDAELVCAVGHVPFVEDIVDRLAGATPPFSTGALACLELQLAGGNAEGAEPAQDSARLLWFAQGPVAQDWDTLVQLQEAIGKRAGAIVARRDVFFADPNDIETLHHFRTSIRAARSLVAFVKPWQSARQNAEMQAILKEVVGHTSRLRELDVLEQTVRADPDASPKLIAFCAREAAAERKRVRKALASKRVTRSLTQAADAAKGLAWKGRIARHGLSQEEVRARYDAMIEAVGAELASVDLANDEQTHDVRKRAKQARYVAEYASRILGPDAKDAARNMTAHQDALGDVCDARANIRLTSEFLRRDLPKPVAQGLARMRAESEARLRGLLDAQAARVS